MGTLTVTHKKVVTTPDDGTSEVGTDEWNDGHSISFGTPPLSSDFSVIGSGITVSDRAGRMVLDVTSGTVIRALSKPVRTAPYTIEAKIQMASAPAVGNAVVCGLFLSDGTKYRGFYVGTWMDLTSANPMYLRFAIDSWTNASTFGASVRLMPVSLFGGFYYVRITDDGTTRNFYLSPNGLDWDLFYSEAANTFVTPTTFGIMAFNASSNSTPMKAVIDHWLDTGSVLADAA